MKVNLIPMAGAGQRFRDAGFILPKPLILAAGKPMIERVIEDLPKADKWIFVVRKEHADNFEIVPVLKRLKPDAVIVIEASPSGQLTSCLAARDHIRDGDELLIASCDSGYLYNREEFERLAREFDAVVWTFTEREILRTSPQSWGWCSVERDGRTIEKVSIKKPVSPSPFHDHAVVATFYFRRAGTFFEAAKRMCESGETIKGEYYVDGLPNVMKERGLLAAIFDVDLYIGWGRPEDAREFEEIAQLIRAEAGPRTEEQRKLWLLWKKYFNSRR